MSVHLINKYIPITGDVVRATIMAELHQAVEKELKYCGIIATEETIMNTVQDITTMNMDERGALQ